ncbi:DedA family protein [Caulobacter segnis]|uniref:DedA family protein n=1 Tax=Caulobacter segnis TaxID=88688 RepID=UPI00240EB659|nr:DedA family protein [Caulobacter segnis]MDG2520394.1 DedA family protein [Caulobacter segnis]
MDAFTHAVSGWIAQNSAWAGLVIGLLTFGESMLVIGAFLPATILLVAAGGLIAAGTLDAASVIVFAIAGAIVGDAVSYALGRKLGEQVLRHRWLAPHEAVVAKARDAALRHGVLALFAGRFGGPLRAFVPVITGVVGMSPLRFHLTNAASGVVWVVAFIAPGYLAARGLVRISAADVTTVVLLGLMAVAILGAATVLIRSRPAAVDSQACTSC